MNRHFYSIRIFTAIHFFSILFTSCNIKNSNNNMLTEQSSMKSFDGIEGPPNSQKKAGNPCVKIVAAGVGGLLLGALITGLATGLPLSEQRNNANNQLDSCLSLETGVMPFTTRVLQGLNAQIDGEIVSGTTPLANIENSASLSITLNTITSSYLSTFMGLFPDVQTLTINSTFLNSTACNYTNTDISPMTSVSNLVLNGYLYQNIIVPTTVQSINLDSANKCFSNLNISCSPNSCTNQNVINTINTYNSQSANLAACYSSIIPAYFGNGTNQWPNGTVSNSSLLTFSGVPSSSIVFKALGNNEFTNVTSLIFYTQEIPNLVVPANIPQVCVSHSLLLGNLTLLAPTLDSTCIVATAGVTQWFGPPSLDGSVLNQNAYIRVLSNSTVNVITSMTGWSPFYVVNRGIGAGYSCVDSSLQPAICNPTLSTAFSTFNSQAVPLWFDNPIITPMCL